MSYYGRRCDKIWENDRDRRVDNNFRLGAKFSENEVRLLRPRFCKKRQYIQHMDKVAFVYNNLLRASSTSHWDCAAVQLFHVVFRYAVYGSDLKLSVSVAWLEMCVANPWVWSEQARFEGKSGEAWEAMYFRAAETSKKGTRPLQNGRANHTKYPCHHLPQKKDFQFMRFIQSGLKFRTLQGSVISWLWLFCLFGASGKWQGRESWPHFRPTSMLCMYQYGNADENWTMSPSSWPRHHLSRE
jgi:hypothetical protein